VLLVLVVYSKQVCLVAEVLCILFVDVTCGCSVLCPVSAAVWRLTVFDVLFRFPNLSSCRSQSLCTIGWTRGHLVSSLTVQLVCTWGQYHASCTPNFSACRSGILWTPPRISVTAESLTSILPKMGRFCCVVWLLRLWLFFNNWFGFVYWSQHKAQSVSRVTSFCRRTRTRALTVFFKSPRNYFLFVVNSSCNETHLMINICLFFKTKMLMVSEEKDAYCLFIDDLASWLGDWRVIHFIMLSW